MQVLQSSQIRQWDAFTIEQEPVTPVNLMERAATQCFKWLQQQFGNGNTYYIFCGYGNNGGDGLAIARMLHQYRQTVQVFILPAQKASPEMEENWNRLTALNIPVTALQTTDDFPRMKDHAIVVDALYGSGLNRPLDGLAAELVQHLNRHSGTVVAIDIPSGLFADAPSENTTIIQAGYTLTFQVPKLAFFMAENEIFTGNWIVLNIQLHPDFIHNTACKYEWVEEEQIRSIIHPLKKNTYKNKLGHALLYAGSKGMMGAAIMSAHGCLRSGVGLLTMAVPDVGLQAVQTTNPQAMCLTEERWMEDKNWEKMSAIGIGPGWSATEDCKAVASKIAKEWKGQLIVDATALAQFNFEKGTENTIPANAVITPHPGEFDRLFGKAANSFERMTTALQKAAELNIYIVLKGAYTFTATPQGKGYFNSTGNPGMAKGGAGDVLTGLLTGLLAQGYTPQQATLLGVYLHGSAGDNAAKEKSEYGMNAMDIAEGITAAWKKIKY